MASDVALMHLSSFVPTPAATSPLPTPVVIFAHVQFGSKVQPASLKAGDHETQSCVSQPPSVDTFPSLVSHAALAYCIHSAWPVAHSAVATMPVWLKYWGTAVKKLSCGLRLLLPVEQGPAICCIVVVTPSWAHKKKRAELLTRP